MSSSYFAYRSFQPHIFPLAIAVIAIFITLAGSDVQEGLRYERSRIFTGEIWRLFTAHFVHLGWIHLLMNLVALGLIWGLAWRALRPSAWLVITLVSMVSVSVGLVMFNPTLEWYVGLSGMLHGLFLAGIMANLRSGHRLEIILLLALCGKVAWEQIYGALPGSAELAGDAVVVDAHLYGLVGGLLSVLPYVLLQHQGKQ